MQSGFEEIGQKLKIYVHAIQQPNIISLNLTSDNGKYRKPPFKTTIMKTRLYVTIFTLMPH